MFESLVREIASRFGLRDQASRFIRLLVDALFDNGGPSAMRERLAAVGLAQAFDTWPSGTPAEDALQPDQFVTAVGQTQSERMASTLGVEPAVVNAAGAYALPRIIATLGRGGALPTSRPADYETWFAAPAAASAAPAAKVVHEPVRTEERRRMPIWAWLLPLLALIALVLALRTCNREPTPAPAPAATAPAAAAAATGTADPSFTFESTADGARIGGRLATADEAARLRSAVASAFGNRVTGDIQVDAATRPATWVDCVAQAIPEFKTPGLRFAAEGTRLDVESGTLQGEQRFAVSRALRTCYAGYETTGLWDRAAAALAGLQRPFTGAQLTEALNLMEIYFDTDSATITRDSYETLKRAAEAIRELPAGTRIEVGGHTDATGSAEHNLQLSDQRAAAVVAKLGELGVSQGVLTAKGYGQTKPKASNDTEEGRAQNRRIEFTVTQ